MLVLFLVGSASPGLVGIHRRTRAYMPDDFTLLGRLVARAAHVTTPNVLAETSNLIRHCDRSRLGPLIDAFRRYATLASERYVPSATAAAAPEFDRLGLNDVTVLAAQERDVTLMTDDLDLYLTAATAGHKVVNFTHERERLLG
ncbi:hypothetical protein [Methylobacterium nigriterrae]|uniref:hypothetical protein n=1 Tax=Methylobacterium nigriterrae TaxID=3127512 RepID=UPI0030134C0A